MLAKVKLLFICHIAAQRAHSEHVRIADILKYKKPLMALAKGSLVQEATVEL
jgi:hypothetical protein